MRLPPVVTVGDRPRSLLDVDQPIDLDVLLPGHRAWQVEIGYGKGKYLLQGALAEPDQRFLGIEVVSKYFRMLNRRARRHGASNLLNIRGEALYLLAAVLPRGFAEVVHVYFPDPWPKARHQRRRLLDPVTVDLVLGVLRPGGRLCFATDFLEYGEKVLDLLIAHPGLHVEPVVGPWPDGARTNYEAKYMHEGRPIVRCVATMKEGALPWRPHPEGLTGITGSIAAD